MDKPTINVREKSVAHTHDTHRQSMLACDDTRASAH